MGELKKPIDIIRTKSLSKFLAVPDKINGPRVLVADIETFPIVAYVWSLWKQNIGLEQIAQDWSMMSFAAKWLGQPELFYMDNRSRDDARDDSLQLVALHAILRNTDMVIAHNGARFDLPKIKARMAMMGYDPLPPVKVIDTLLLNRKTFMFTSQRLGFVSDRFANVPKDDHAAYPGFKLWLGCMANEKAAWAECEKYNITDVTSLEETYLALRGWYEGAPNFGPYTTAEEGERVCPNCGGKHVIHRGTRKTQVGTYPRYKCVDCGAWSRGRFMLVSREERQHILMN